MRKYDKDTLEWLKKEIARAAIRVSIELEARKNSMQCSGDAKAGFILTDAVPPPGGSNWVQRLPPVEAPTGEIPTWYKDDVLQPTPTMDVWATLYAPWFDAVEEVLDGWDGLPESQPFKDMAGHIEIGGKPLYVHVAGADDEDGVGANSGLTDDLSTKIDTITSITANFYGATALTFHDNYSSHLKTVAAGQYQLTGALAAALQAEGEILEEAGSSVMGLAEAAVAAMRSVNGDGPGRDPRDPTAVLNILGIVAGAAANLFKKFNLAGTLTSGAISLFDEIFPEKTGRERRELPLAGATPDDVLDNLRSALAKLNGEILEEETAISTAAADAVDLSYGRVDDTYFNLPPPVLVTETDAKLLQGNPPNMRTVGNVHMPWVAGQFAKVFQDIAPDRPGAAETSGAVLGSTAPWMRPGFIGFTDVGPHHAVSSLYERLRFLLNDTAGELRAAGKSFALAADVLEGADAGAQQELNKHAAKVADVAAPDPAAPRQEAPSGGYRP